MPNVELAPLIGRDAVLADIRRLLLSDGVRFVTLTGPGGTGKTRLAQTIAAEWGAHAPLASVYFVDLSVVDHAAEVPASIANAFRAQEMGAQPVTEILQRLVATSVALLVLDNFDRVMGAAEFVSDLVAGAPGITCLVTSREPLRIRAERVYPIAPLAMPDAIRLFEDRSQSRQPNFSVTPDNTDTIAEICRRLDGLPLAIELAAAQIGVLSLPLILTRLDAHAPFVVDGARDLPERHRTLNSTVRWSYDLLDDSEQLAFRRCGVFTGPFGLRAHAALDGDGAAGARDVLPTLARLANKSLVQVVEESCDDEPRFRLLETIRLFAIETLDAVGELDDLRYGHAIYFAETAEQAEELLTGPGMGVTLSRLERDYDNFRAALAWSIDSPRVRDLIIGMRLAGALNRFWMLRGHLGDARHWLERALARSCEVPASVRAKALNAVGVLAGMQGDNTGAEAYFRESYQLWESVGDPVRMAAAMGNIGLATQDRDIDHATACFQKAEALYASVGNQRGVAVSIGSRANLARQRGETRDAVELFRLALSLFREVGDPRGTANSLANLGHALVVMGRPEHAVSHFREALELRDGLGNTLGVAECLEGFAAAAAYRRQGRRAARLQAAASVLRESTGASLPTADREFFNQVNQRIERQLLPEVLAREREAGRALTADEAIAYALRDGNRRTRRTTLSEREWEVAEHVARGQTNRQIAGALHLSRRTVGTHLEHIFSKLGFQNRSELAVWIARQPEIADSTAGAEPSA